MNIFKPDSIVFSSKLRLSRHVLFWIVYTILIAFLWQNSRRGLGDDLIRGFMWLPVRILFCYPLMYWVLPQYLLKEKYLKFSVIILLWVVAGYLINYLFRYFIFIPFQEHLNFNRINKDPWAYESFLVLTTTAGVTCVIVLFKHWFDEHRQWMQAEKEKITAELQLLKAQVHPHFLFNTLNNIYSFSLENSPKTPGLILKLSALLSYMLYDCKTEEVLLEKEIEIMKNYIDLEKVRYGNKIEISWSTEGNIKGKYIAPLLLLPFLENAFKHGTSDELDRPWLSVDISVKEFTLKCKIANSKNEYLPVASQGIGIQNVRKRLAFLYPDSHVLKMNDEGNFFVVSLLIKLEKISIHSAILTPVILPAAENISP